jgi:hypothetical protein
MSDNLSETAAMPASIPLAPDFAKRLARRLADELVKADHTLPKLKHSQLLEVIAGACGHRDWNTMSAAPLPQRGLTIADLPARTRKMIERGNGDYVLCKSIRPDNPVLFHSHLFFSDFENLINGDEDFIEITADNHNVTPAAEFSKLADEEYESRAQIFHDETIWDLWRKYGTKAIDRAENLAG